MTEQRIRDRIATCAVRTFGEGALFGFRLGAEDHGADVVSKRQLALVLGRCFVHSDPKDFWRHEQIAGKAGGELLLRFRGFNGSSGLVIQIRPFACHRNREREQTEHGGSDDGSGVGGFFHYVCDLVWGLGASLRRSTARPLLCRN